MEHAGDFAAGTIVFKPAHEQDAIAWGRELRARHRARHAPPPRTLLVGIGGVFGHVRPLDILPGKLLEPPTEHLLSFRHVGRGLAGPAISLALAMETKRRATTTSHVENWRGRRRRRFASAQTGRRGVARGHARRRPSRGR